MKTVTFQSVLWGITRGLGLNPQRDLSPARAGMFEEYVNNRVREAWRFEFWPEWTVVEQRYYRPVYDATAAVSAGDERYYPPAEAYYQALRAQNPAAQAPATANGTSWTENSAYWAACAQTYSGADWATGLVLAVGDKVRNPNDGQYYQCISAHVAGGSFDATKFGMLKSFNKYVAYEQSGQTVIDHVKAVWRRNPRVNTRNPGPLAFVPSDAGIQLDWRAPVSVWLEFRLIPPQFSATSWASTTTYAAGDLAYRAPHSYLALQASTNKDPATQATYWQLVKFPEVIASAVKRMAIADALKDQKETDRAVEEMEEAQAELQDASDRELAAQGVADSAAVSTYGQ